MKASPAALQDIKINSKPYIFGIKDTFRLEPVKDHVIITRADSNTPTTTFTATGKTLMIANTVGGHQSGGPGCLLAIPLDEKITNHTLGAYLQPKFTFGWFSLEPGVRADYLERTGQTLVDPRGIFSIEFPTETTFSVAGGRYSYFFQTNPFLFMNRPR